MSNYKNRLLCAGTVAYDSIKTPFKEVKRILGGSATYFSFAARLFTKPSIVAVAGEDFKDVNAFNKFSINIKDLEIKSGATFSWGGEYAYDMNSRITLFTNLGVLENFNPTLSPENQNSSYVFLGNTHPKIQLKVLRQIKNPKLVGLDTMNMWIESAPAELAAVLKQIDVLLVNDSEARELSKTYSLSKAAKIILKKLDKNKTSTLIIKKGEHGLLMFQKNHVFALPGFPLENIQDPTGAGDSFAGALMGYLTKTRGIGFQNLKKACVTASCAASFCVEEFGSLALQKLTLKKLNSRTKSFKRLIAH